MGKTLCNLNGYTHGRILWNPKKCNCTSFLEPSFTPQGWPIKVWWLLNFWDGHFGLNCTRWSIYFLTSVLMVILWAFRVFLMKTQWGVLKKSQPTPTRRQCRWGHCSTILCVQQAFGLDGCSSAGKKKTGSREFFRWCETKNDMLNIGMCTQKQIFARYVCFFQNTEREKSIYTCLDIYYMHSLLEPLPQKLFWSIHGGQGAFCIGHHGWEII